MNHSELERAIERAARRARENALIVDHFDAMAKLWKERTAPRAMLPDPVPYQSLCELSRPFDPKIWLNWSRKLLPSPHAY